MRLTGVCVHVVRPSDCSTDPRHLSTLPVCTSEMTGKLLIFLRAPLPPPLRRDTPRPSPHDPTRMRPSAAEAFSGKPLQIRLPVRPEAAVTDWPSSSRAAAIGTLALASKGRQSRLSALALGLGAPCSCPEAVVVTLRFGGGRVGGVLL